jgi:NAD(P)H-flavin reductase
MNRLPCRSGLRAAQSVRYASTSTSTSTPSSTSSKKSRNTRWLGILFVGATATATGAYIRQSNDSATLNQETFTKYRLVSREPVSATSSLFTLRPRKPSETNYDVYEEAWATGVWSVMFKQPQLQIGRDYTPLPTTAATGLSVEDENEGCLRFFIRKDPFGEVSRYLHKIDIGADVEMRGPKIECVIPKETGDILFIAGGTGIAPALQAGYSLLSRGEKSRIHILWANRLKDDCAGGQSDSLKPVPSRGWFSGWFGKSQPVQEIVSVREEDQSLIVRELEALKSQYPGQVTVDYYLDEENTFIGKEAIRASIDSVPAGDSGKSKLILVSGPEGFISYMAGPKLWAQGQELQGPLNGVIKELDLKDWGVWKL